jgi:hypothetical protein
MDNMTGLARYKAAVAAYKSWLEQGAITEDDFIKIEADTARRHGINYMSIYREMALNCVQKRANID